MKSYDMTQYANEPLDRMLELVADGSSFSGEAMYSLACREELGKEEQLVWLVKAAYCGFPHANLQLAFYYMERDEFLKAHYWLSRAEKLPGCKEAVTMVNDAVELLERRTALEREVALRDELEPVLELAQCYEELVLLARQEDPLHLTKNLHLPTKEEAARDAFRCYELAASMGDSDARYKVREYRRFGANAVGETNREKRERIVFHCYQEAAYMGDLKACISLGLLYQYQQDPIGDLSEQEAKKMAFKYFKAAAAAPQGPYILGNCYAEGMGVEQDYVEAARCYKQSADRGHAYACLSLAVCYEYGRGVKRNLNKALSYSKQARVYGLRDAGLSVDYYKDKLEHYLPVEKHQRLAKQGNVVSQYELAQAYFYGYEVEKDLKQAFYWYSKAAEQNYTPAYLKLSICYNKGYGVVADEDQGWLWQLRYTNAPDVKKFKITDHEN